MREGGLLVNCREALFARRPLLPGRLIRAERPNKVAEGVRAV